MTRIEAIVGLFYDGGPLRPCLDSDPSIRVVPLGKQGRWDIIRFLFRLVGVLRSLKPDVIHGYLPDANLLALLAGRLASVPTVVWGIRASNMDFSRYGFIPRVVFRIAAWLSGFADLIISNSFAGARFHQESGYSGRRMVVVPNGVDTDLFAPAVDFGKEWRTQWDVPDRGILIGIVGRIDPMKGYEVFLEAAAGLARDRADVWFICLGTGPVAYKERLIARAVQLGVQPRFRWVGHCDDMRRAYNALDILSSPSVFGEGFSNVVGEAMACGVPCVVTDVGDAKQIVGDTGLVIPPREANALQAAWSTVLAMGTQERQALGAKARARVVDHYRLERMVANTTTALETAVIAKRRGGRA